MAQLIIYGETSDGYLKKQGPEDGEFKPQRIAQVADYTFLISDELGCGIYWDEETIKWSIYRPIVVFNTNIVTHPELIGATITGLQLSLFVTYVDAYDDGYNNALSVQKGIEHDEDRYPHIPIELADYLYTHWEGNAGHLHFLDLGAPGSTPEVYRTWNLADGLTWLQLTGAGLTKLIIRHNWDITGADNEQAGRFYFSSAKGTNKPKLIVDYTPGGIAIPVASMHYKKLAGD